MDGGPGQRVGSAGTVDEDGRWGEAGRRGRADEDQGGGRQEGRDRGLVEGRGEGMGRERWGQKEAPKRKRPERCKKDRKRALRVKETRGSADKGRDRGR